jgi:hypothetical protein
MSQVFPPDPEDPASLICPEAVCPHCHQPIMLLADGRLARHNKPGWARQAIREQRDGKPETCKGSGAVPESQ